MCEQEWDSCVDPVYQISDELWERIEPLLPPEPPKHEGGRPREPARKMMTAIFYVLRTGCQWNALPRCLGAASTVHDRFQEWRAADVFERLWQAGVLTYAEKKGLNWEWQAIDGAMTKAPLGGEATGPNPTDRAKVGTKRSLMTDGNGMPIGVAVAGANRHDKKLTEATLQSLIVERPDPEEQPQHMCLDKGYDFDDIRELLEAWGYTAHIRTRGEEEKRQRDIPGYQARRWVVERTHSWLNRFRRILVRWEKKADNYLALLHFACAWITFHATEVFG